MIDIRRFILWPLVLLLLLFGSSAGASLLWAVQGEHNTVYLLGSMHMLPRQAYPMPVAMESAFESSSTVVFETDIDAVMSPVLQMKMMEFAALPGGQTLQQRLGERRWNALSSRAASLNLPPMILNQVRPWFAANLLALQALQNNGYQRSLGLDLHYWKRAGRAGKQRGWLESMDDQLQVFADMDERESERFLEMTLRDLNEIEEDPLRPFRLWRDGDNDEIQEELEKIRQDAPGFYRRIHEQRNRRWVPQIEQYLQSRDNVLIVVGAMHFVGEDGLISLLVQRGMRPIPLPLTRRWDAEEI